MERMTVAKTVIAGLCTSCGACAGICPRECIRWKKEKGLYVPEIDAGNCISCGMCASVCPGMGHVYIPKGDAIATVTGEHLALYNAWSRNPEIRHMSASGGVVSTMVGTLLEQGRYDSVFCLDTYDYREQLQTKRFDPEKFGKTATAKSRYLPVSHEQAIRYMKANRRERIVLIATSCALRGILAAIEKLKLDRDNYLLIGLFCDKVFNYNVHAYFENRFCGGEPLEAMHFKNKESGGWPGDMKMFPKGKESFYVPIGERGRVKEYFMPERCLYCVDKLNVNADISLGDNYTGINSSELGSNSVMIRTSRGMAAWDAALEQLEYYPVEIAAIQKAQYLEGRLNNLYFADLKSAQLGKDPDLNRGVPRTQDCNEFRLAWEINLKKLRAGQVYDTNKAKLEKQMHQDSRKPNPATVFVKRCYHFARRKLAGLYR